jgi:hypothetical protein
MRALLCHRRPVHPGLRQLGARLEAAAFRVPWYVAEDPFGTRSTSSLRRTADATPTEHDKRNSFADRAE